MREEDIKLQICEIGKRIYDREYVAANDGNISIRTMDNIVYCTPTGVSKGYMTPEMIVKMDLKGNILEKGYTPSSEIKMHLKVYQKNPEVFAVCHAHPAAATAYAIAGVSIDRPTCPEAVVLLGNVPVAAYATPGTDGVADAVEPYCKDYNALLLANHGALTWGKDLVEAYYRMETLEHSCKIKMYSEHMIGKVNELSAEEVEELLALREKMGIRAGGKPVFQNK